MIEARMHTFPKTPIAPEYTALAVLLGSVAHPVWEYNGRLCYVAWTTRVKPPGRHAYNVCGVRYLDGTAENVPAGRFNKGARWPKAPLPEGAPLTLGAGRG